MNSLGAVLRKELDELRPFALLCLLLWSTPPVFEVFTDFMDDDLLVRGDSLHGSMSEVYILLHILLTLSMTAGLIAREEDQGTVAFLDALPVRRSTLLAGKVMVAFGCLMAGPAALVAMFWAEHALARTSLVPGMHADLALLPLLAHGAFVFGWLGLGLLLSFLRRIGWALAALFVVGLPKLAETWPELGPFLPEEFLDLQLRGAELVTPWAEMAVWTALGAVGLTLSGLAWSGGGRRVLAGMTRAGTTLWGRTLLSALGLVSVGVWCWAIDDLLGDDDGGGGQEDATEAGARFNRWGSAVLVTKRFLITTDSAQLERAKELGLEADAIHDRVAGWLGAEPFEERLRVDALALRRSHGRLGRQLSEGLELDLANLETEKAEAVLAHEVAHALAERRSDGSLSKYGLWTRWFNEGLAKWVERRFERVALDAADQVVLAAACSHKLRELEFETLIEDDLLRGRRHKDLVYGLGSLWVDELAELHGDDAPGRVLAALGREDAPDDVDARSLWEDALQSQGYDIEGVLQGWDARLEELGQVCPKPPPLTAALEWTDDEILIAQLDPAPEGVRRTCWLRTSRDASTDQWRRRNVVDDTCEWSDLPRMASDVDVLIGTWIGGAPVTGRWVPVALE